MNLSPNWTPRAHQLDSQLTSALRAVPNLEISTPVDTVGRPESPSKVGVLLIHGLSGTPSEMKFTARHLRKQGYEVAVPLLPGHGACASKLVATDWQDWLAGAREALNNLCQSHNKVVVGGLSMGGLLALLLSRENPKVCGVVSIAPTIKYDGPNLSRWRLLLPLLDLLPFCSGLFYWTESPPYGLKDERLQKTIAAHIARAKQGGATEFGQFRTYAGSLRQLQHLVKQVKKQAPQIDCPVLIIHSLADTISSSKGAELLYSWLGSEDKSTIWLDGCDHVLTLDLKKQEVADHFADFASRVTGIRIGNKPV